MKRPARQNWLVIGLVAGGLCLAGPAVAQSDQQAMAQMQARILELGEEVRRLNGRLEEAEFRQRQLEMRVDQLSEQLAARPAATLPNAPTDLAALAPAEPAPAAPLTIIRPDQRPANPSGQVTAPPERSLGTIPREALLAIERPGERPSEQPGERTGEPAAVPQASPETMAALAAGNADERMAAIQQLLANGDWNSAQPALERFLADFPDSQHADRASFWLGETLFSAASYDQAAAQFAENFRTFGGESPNAADNLLKLGMSLGRHGDVENACVAFLEFERRFPDAPPALRQTMERDRQFFECS